METTATATRTAARSTRSDDVGRWALVVATVATGLFAGLIWTFSVAIDRAEERLDAVQYATWRQFLIQDLDRGILPVLILTAVAPVVALVALRHRSRSAAWRLTAAAFVVYILGVMVYTLVLNVPINNAMLDWNPAAPPADWAEKRDRWDLLNTIRTPVTIGAFSMYLAGLMALVREQTRDALGRGAR